MSYIFPTNYFFPNNGKIVVVDSESSPFLPKAVINPYITTPITGSLLAVTPNPDFKPIFTTPLLPENNLNYNPNVHESVSFSIYKKVFDSWLYKSDFKDLYKYVKIVDNEPKLATEKNEDDSSDSHLIEKKIKFFKDYILSKHRVKEILKDFVAGSRTNWYDVEKNSYYVKELIYKYMKKKLKKLIEKKLNK